MIAMPEAVQAITGNIAKQRRYPRAGFGIALQIDAKVALGEMCWG